MKKHITRHRLNSPRWSKPTLVLQIGTLMNTGDSDDVVPSCQNKDYYSWRDAEVTDFKLLGTDIEVQA